jgi:hypothetical protein
VEITAQERDALVEAADTWLMELPTVEQAMADDPTLKHEDWTSVQADAEATAEQLRSFLWKAEREKAHDDGTDPGELGERGGDSSPE